VLFRSKPSDSAQLLVKHPDFRALGITFTLISQSIISLLAYHQWHGWPAHGLIFIWVE